MRTPRRASNRKRTRNNQRVRFLAYGSSWLHGSSITYIQFAKRLHSSGSSETSRSSSLRTMMIVLVSTFRAHHLIFDYVIQLPSSLNENSLHCLQYPRGTSREYIYSLPYFRFRLYHSSPPLGARSLSSRSLSSTARCDRGLPPPLCFLELAM